MVSAQVGHRMFPKKHEEARANDGKSALPVGIPFAAMDTPGHLSTSTRKFAILSFISSS